MKSMNNSFTKFKNVLEAVLNEEIGEYDREGNYKSEPVCFNIYWKNDMENKPTLEDVVYMGEPSKVSKDVPDEEYDHALLPEKLRIKTGVLHIVVN